MKVIFFVSVCKLINLKGIHKTFYSYYVLKIFDQIFFFIDTIQKINIEYSIKLFYYKFQNVILLLYKFSISSWLIKVMNNFTDECFE